MTRYHRQLLLSVVLFLMVFSNTPTQAAHKSAVSKQEAQQTFYRVMGVLPAVFPSTLGPGVKTPKHLGEALQLINSSFKEITDAFPKKSRKLVELVFRSPRTVEDGDPRWTGVSSGVLAAARTESSEQGTSYYTMIRTKVSPTKIVSPLLRVEEALHIGHMHMRIGQIGDEAYVNELDSGGLHAFTELAFTSVEKRLHDIIPHTLFEQDILSLRDKIGLDNANHLLGWHADRVHLPFSKYIRTHHPALNNVEPEDIERALEKWNNFDANTEATFDNDSNHAYQTLPAQVKAGLDLLGR